MTIPWYLSALGAAIIWGIHYPLIDFALKRVSIFTVILLSIVPVIMLLPFFYKSLLTDWSVIRLLPFHEQAMIAVIGLTSILGAVLVYISIANKNATLASLIEITYPVFVVIFAYLFFKQVHINMSVIVGGIFVIAGSCLIIFNNHA